MASNNKKDIEWAVAKKKCRLNEATVKMARDMELNPGSLIKNIPSESEQWKALVSIWIQEMYQKMRRKGIKEKDSEREIYGIILITSLSNSLSKKTFDWRFL